MKKQIISRLKEFKSLNEKQQFQEFQFCLLTPQSNAQRCWQAIEEISKLKKPTQEQITKILSTKTRFHNTKAKRILNAPKVYNKIKNQLHNPNIPQLRNFLVDNVDGYGL
ncbi:MAG: DNA lyase, partial [Nanoarchaeota archaeon]